MKINITIPESLKEIKVKDYQKYMDIVEANKDADNDDFLTLKLIEIFCGVKLSDVYQMPISDVEDITAIIGKTFQEDYKFKNRFTIDNIEYGFIPNLEDLSVGEYADINNYLGDIQNLHKALAVLYRPITEKSGDLYRIEDYEGSDKYSGAMKYAPLDIALASQVFFYLLGIELLNSTADYLEAEMTNNPTLQNLISDANGAGMESFTQSLKEICNSLKLPNVPTYTKHLHG